jgi:hypothetical protein
MKLQLPKRRIWRVAIYLVSMFLVLVAADVVLVQCRRTIHPGFETTRIVAPLQDDGSIDYLIAVDRYFGAGVTPNNNAAILILRAMGRQAIPKYQAPDALTDTLGMPHIPEKGNYFVTYEDYCKQRSITPTEWSDLTHPRPWPVNFDNVTLQWVNDNEKPLALITEATKRPRFFIPFYAGYRPETMIEIQIPQVSLIRNAGGAFRTRALMRLAAGDVAGSRADLMTAHRLARLIGQQATFVEKVTAINMEISACEAERVGISSGKLSADQSRSMAQELAALGNLPPTFDSLDMGERFFALDVLQTLARQGPIRAGQLINAFSSMPDWRFGPPAFFLFVPIPYEAAMRNINHYEDGLLAVLRQPTYPERIAAMLLLEQNKKNKEAKDLTLSDLVNADWPLQLLAPSLQRVMEKEETALMENRLTQIALMLSVFKAEHGSYPATLEDLSPTYLKTIPNDLFSAKPLIYSPTEKGFILYSVGPNMIDDGGAKDDISASAP